MTEILGRRILFRTKNIYILKRPSSAISNIDTKGMSIPIVGSFLRSIHLDARKVMSEADLPMVGIMDVTTAERRVPVRLFYPSSAKEEGNVGSFVRGFDYFIDGYLHTLLPWFRDNALVLWLIAWISYALSWLAPMGHASLPSCAYGAPPVSSKGQKYPLIIFSHGLTGTGTRSIEIQPLIQL